MLNKTAIIIAALLVLLFLSFAAFVPKKDNDTVNGKYRLVFNDEFNLPNGSQPDSAKWSRCNRYNSIWNRWVSSSKDVVYIKDRSLVCRAIPNTTEKSDTAKMLTGAIWTRDKFAFKYGLLKVRMKTNLIEGNFPAVWLGRQPKDNVRMPYGEIDVVEMFGQKKESNHNIHTQLTIDNNKHGFKNSFKHNVDVTKWHVYEMEWTPLYVKWFVDGKVVGTYYKSADKKMLREYQWTFDDYFFILLNQSVGDGTHGLKEDTSKVYETRFDWIRVYKKI